MLLTILDLIREMTMNSSCFILSLLQINKRKFEQNLSIMNPKSPVLYMKKKTYKHMTGNTSQRGVHHFKVVQQKLFSLIFKDILKPKLMANLEEHRLNSVNRIDIVREGGLVSTELFSISNTKNFMESMLGQQGLQALIY